MLHPHAQMADLTDEALKLDWLITLICGAVIGSLESVIIANNEYAAMTTTDVSNTITNKIRDHLRNFPRPQ